MVQYLIPLIIFLGAIVYYIYYIAPRKDPLNRAQNFIEQKMYQEAIVEYKKLLEKNPGNFVVHYRLGKLYFDFKKIDQGVAHLENILNINKFNIEVDRVEVLRMLANAYMLRDEIEEAFQAYIDILNVYPNDEEALYHVSFISLGQELFELASRHFERLVKVSKNNFNILFGAGIAVLQEQRIGDAVNYFKEALKYDAHSDIGNIAMAYSLQKKRDFRTGVNYAKMVADNSKDINAGFIARRVLGFILVRSGNYGEALNVFQELYEFTKKNDMFDDMAPVLYDLGFVAIKAEKTDLAYEYWDQSYQIDRGYKNTQKLITILRKDMDQSADARSDKSVRSIDAHADEWLMNAFPENFIWKICGLKSDKEINLDNVYITSKISAGKKPAKDEASAGRASFSSSDLIGRFYELNVENFRIIASRIVSKLGYNVDEILNTYKEPDGVDFFARSLADERRALIWVRRWKDTNVGEIPLRNFAQAINDIKANEGLFITTTNLNASAEKALKNLSKVKIIYPDKLTSLLGGLL